MPYVLFHSRYKPEGPRVIDNTVDHYSIHNDEFPIMLAYDKLERDPNVASVGVAKIEAASEPQWTDNDLL
jgi:hypothetical protein